MRRPPRRQYTFKLPNRGWGVMTFTVSSICKRCDETWFLRVDSYTRKDAYQYVERHEPNCRKCQEELKQEELDLQNGKPKYDFVGKEEG